MCGESEECSVRDDKRCVGSEECGVRGDKSVE